jgi:hypothetical protein
VPQRGSLEFEQEMYWAVVEAAFLTVHRRAVVRALW